MIRALALIACLVPAASLAQSTFEPPADLRAAHEMMRGQRMMQGQHMMDGQLGREAATQPGQGAFAAIQEVVEILMADPKTDWSKVNIDALRQHLIDMNNVTLAANVKNQPIDRGVRFDVTGEGPVRNSIRRMTAMAYPLAAIALPQRLARMRCGKDDTPRGPRLRQDTSTPPA